MIMTAIDYFEDVFPNSYKRTGELERKFWTEFAESYHQAKSKEEAEERYKEAIESLKDQPVSLGPLVDVAPLGNALRLAAFGKEGEG